MSINGVSSVNPLLAQLETQGLSANKASLVETDVATAIGNVSTGSAPAAITPSVRAAIDTKIASDVLSGKLSASDAAAVKKTLDDLGGDAGAATDATAATGTATAAQAGDTKGTGKSHGGGGSAKTEVSETVTIDGSTETTVITYSDNTTSTVTTMASDADIAKYSKPAATGSASGATKDYTQSIAPGLLIDQLA